jgi:hypothetical protein
MQIVAVMQPGFKETCGYSPGLIHFSRVTANPGYKGVQEDFNIMDIAGA